MGSIDIGHWARQPSLVLRTAICAGLLSVAVAASAARHLDIEQRAMAACISAFVKQIMPDARDHVRFLIPEASGVFTGRHSFDWATMTLRAQAARSGDELASGFCTVARDSHVKQLRVTVRDAMRLATLTAGDLKLAVTAN